MHILHTIPSFGVKSGGTSTCVYDLLKALNEDSCQTDIVTLEQPDSTDHIIGNGEGWIKVQSFDARSPFLLSSNLKHFLQSENEYDLYHTNGLWLYCNHITASIARKKGKPYIISPHGMLYPQALARSSWKKVLMRKICFDKDLAHANCIHTTSITEMKYYRQLGFSNPVAIIPNLIPILYQNNFRSNSLFQFSYKRFGFVGRIHPIKNIDILIRAWSKIDTKGCELVIVGEGIPTYMDTLKKLAARLNINNIVFTGFLQGAEKQQMLTSFQYLILPSQSENFGMVVPEALIQGIPVIASKGTPWEDLNIYRCGWWIDNDVQTLATTISEALSVSEVERLAMGERGKQLVRESYSVEIVAEKMKRLYEWILGGGGNPDFVYLK